MADNSSWMTPGVIIAIASILITAAGWIVTAILAMKNNSRNLKKLETNRLIDELYFKLDVIYNELLDLMQNNSEERYGIVYFQFVALVKHVEFTCGRIQELDATQTIDSGYISDLRQACTNDTKYSKNRIGTTLTEIQSVAEKIKKKYTKKF